MLAPSNDIAQYISMHTELELGNDLFYGDIPENREGVFLVDVPSMPQHPNIYIDDLDIQVKAKYKKYDDAYCKLVIAKDCIEGMIDNPIINDSVYFSFIVQNFGFLEKDVNNYVIWVCNVRMMRNPVGKFKRR